MKMPATVNNLARLFTESLEEVRSGKGEAPSVEEIESATFLVFQAMTSRSRDYHGLSHLFKVAEDLPALARLAAIYHDVVYFHVDGGFPANVAERVGDVVECRADGIFLTMEPDEWIADLATLFDFRAGQELSPDRGLSEFLSAALAVRELNKFLSVQEIWSVAACIEATIPFRPAADDLLGQRLRSLRRGGTSLTDEEIENIQLLAVRIANADVQGFAQANPDDFLENTWQLLREINPEFHHVGAYSVRSYRKALVQVEGFLSNLDCTLIFRQHGNTPNAEEHRLLLQRSGENLRNATLYLRATIAAISVLEALAECSGGDGPLSYFTGTADSGNPQIHELLQPLNTQHPPLDAEVLLALKSVHSSINRFDNASSALAAYFYELLGNSGTAEMVRHASEVHAGKENWTWFLASLPPAVVSDVASAVAQNAVARSDRFKPFLMSPGVSDELPGVSDELRSVSDELPSVSDELPGV